jgi:RNA polymerase sigma-70 factor (ECF subfamily)
LNKEEERKMRLGTETQYTPELKLIAGCRQGDSEAIAELFGRHYQSYLSVARGFLHSFEESQDAVQAAYFSAFRHLDSFRGESSFRTWMTRLVINQCRMILRKPARRVNWISLDDPNLSVRPIQLAAEVPTPEKFVLSQEISSAMAEARLPEPMREIFTLCAVSGFTINEAAAVLGLTRAAAKTRLFRAHVRMRASLRLLWQAHRNVAAD